MSDSGPTSALKYGELSESYPAHGGGGALPWARTECTVPMIPEASRSAARRTCGKTITDGAATTVDPDAAAASAMRAPSP